MPIPDFQTLMLPFLQLLSDKQPRHINDIWLTLCDQYNLTAEEREELLPSRSDYTMRNRVGWTRTYLKKAGLLESPSRGVFKITTEGLRVLSEKPSKVNVAYLRTLPSFQKWQDGYTSKEVIPALGEAETKSAIGGDTSKTPDELMSIAYVQLQDSLAFELLQKIRTLTPKQFERLVLKVLTAMGYGGYEDSPEHTGHSGDGGIDGIIKQDKLGLDTIYIQAKLYKETVPIAHVRDFVGALAGKKANKGVIITSSDFPASAEAFLTPVTARVVTINGKQLAELMIKHNVGVSIKETFFVKNISDEFFEEELV